MNKIVGEDDSILAAVMGHELAHLTKGHAKTQITPDLKSMVLSREHEIEADLEGVKIAVAAGFSYKGGIKNAFRAWKVLGDISNFEGIKGTHPSWTDRLALLDREQAQIWKAMAAFQNGFFFLCAEQYRTAEICFAKVVEDFPDCAEAWANLGYARLMQYCDGLDDKDLRGYGIGQFAAGGFYARPAGLATERGILPEKWQGAVKALEIAVKRDDDLVLARANLGLAYLVHPDGKQIDKALEYFRKADSHKEPAGPRLNYAAFQINFGVAEMAQGSNQLAAQKFARARKHLAALQAIPVKEFPLLNDPNLALLYNEALLDAVGPDKEKKARAFQTLEDYLGKASPDSAWWPLAHERYVKLGQELAQKCQSREALAKRSTAQLLRVLTSVEVAPNKVLTLSDATADVLKLLGREKSIGVPLFPDSKIKRYFVAAPGMDLVANDRLLAVFLTSAKAPPLYVQAHGTGAKKKELRVGMLVRDLEEILRGQTMEERPLDQMSVDYVYLPYLGLGYRASGDRVVELVVAQVPRK
jgi:tetratricopeptide (TPR) repeat protein